jgi:hypothetical protein
MTRKSSVAIAISALAIALLPGVIARARADDGQSVRTQSGKVRCYVHANDVSHGGGPLVVCQKASARPFPSAPFSAEYNSQLNLAVVRGNAQFYWDIGNIPGSKEAMAQDIVLNYGQTYHINGWTILPSFDGTRFTNDRTGHGMFVSVEDVHSF